MALHFDLTKIKGFKKLCYNKDDSMSPVTHALIFGSLSTGIREITEETVDQVAERFCALGLVGVFFLYAKGDGSNRNPTLAEIKAHVGLSTNASRITDAMFKRHLGESLLDTAQRRMAEQLICDKLKGREKADLKVAK
jgi:hypothetical protein